MMKRHLLSPKHSRGSSLLVALVFMVIMAMLGIAIANVSILEERMAGNTRDRDLAFQAAEAALKSAEAQLQSAAVRGAAVAYDINRNNTAYWETCFTTSVSPCTAANTHTPTTALPTSGSGAIAAQPKFIVESKTPTSPPTEIYRVTVRGVGGTADAVVILQAEFNFTP
jgi:type IV pilus assembly protein PilX